MSYDPQVRRPARLFTLSGRGARHGQRTFRSGGICFTVCGDSLSKDNLEWTA